MIKDIGKLREAIPSEPRSLANNRPQTPEERELGVKERQLSDALRNMAEAEIVEFDTKPEWHNVSDEDKDKVEERKLEEYFKLIRHQLKRLDSLKGLMRNGDLSEHYFLLLVRYNTASTADQIVPIESSLDRQDRPMDGLYDRNKFSYDALIRYNDSHKLQYVQLKAGREPEVGEYNEGITVINPFGNTTNKDVRQQINIGINQLGGLLNELIDNVQYEGSTETVEQHLGRISDKLSK